MRVARAGCFAAGFLRGAAFRAGVPFAVFFGALRDAPLAAAFFAVALRAGALRAGAFFVVLRGVLLAVAFRADFFFGAAFAGADFRLEPALPVLFPPDLRPPVFLGVALPVFLVPFFTFACAVFPFFRLDLPPVRAVFLPAVVPDARFRAEFLPADFPAVLPLLDADRDFRLADAVFFFFFAAFATTERRRSTTLGAAAAARSSPSSGATMLWRSCNCALAWAVAMLTSGRVGSSSAGAAIGVQRAAPKTAERPNGRNGARL